MERPKEKLLYCYCYAAGEVIKKDDGSVEYKGGCTMGMVINQDTTYEQFVKQACDRHKIDRVGLSFKFSLKFDQSKLQPLRDEESMLHLLWFNDGFAFVYIFGADIKDGSGTAQSDRFSTKSQADSNQPRSLQSQHTCNDLPETSAGYMTRCAVAERGPLISSTWEDVIVGSGQVFSNANEFRNAVYKLSIAGQFKYKFKRNCPQFLSVHCIVDGCPWKVTASSVCGRLKLVKVNTFDNIHRHSTQDTISMQPAIRAKCVASILEDTIRANPDYLSRQSCKDFLRQHGMSLSYHQAWRCKEKTKERIHGNVDNSYKCLPWWCSRLMETNPGTIAEWTNTDDGSFKRLFIAYGCSINGFLLRCRPIIVIDSCDLRGPCKGAFLSATAYDADDCIFPLAYALVSSENYEDWLWFVQHLKRLVQSLDVIIISDRNNDILQSVGEVFGTKNHAYCYQHVKENFGSQLSKKNTNGRKGKVDALALLDAVAYARSEFDYDDAMKRLGKYNSDLARWVEENSPEHWAMSKFPKKCWDKITTTLDESFNKLVEHHHTIFNFVTNYMHKLAKMLYSNQVAVQSWRGPIGPNIELKLQENIARGQGLQVLLYHDGRFKVDVGNADLSVNLVDRECTCMAWQMSGIPCEHACAAIQKMGHDVYSFVEECYHRSTQEKIYFDLLCPVATNDMPNIDSMGHLDHDLIPPKTKRPPGRPRQKHIKSRFMQKRLVYCSRCHEPGHNRSSCKNLNLA